ARDDAVLRDVDDGDAGGQGEGQERRRRRRTGRGPGAPSRAPRRPRGGSRRLLPRERLQEPEVELLDVPAHRPEDLLGRRERFLEGLEVESKAGHVGGLPVFFLAQAEGQRVTLPLEELLLPV